jgi:hypothetical protein
VADSSTICSSRSRRSVRKLLDTYSYSLFNWIPRHVGLWESRAITVSILDLGPGCRCVVNFTPPLLNTWRSCSELCGKRYKIKSLCRPHHERNPNLSNGKLNTILNELPRFSLKICRFGNYILVWIGKWQLDKKESAKLKLKFPDTWSSKDRDQWRTLVKRVMKFRFP